MASKSSIQTFRLTDHAKLEMARRQISETEVAQVLSAPEQTESAGRGRQIYQSRVIWGQAGKTYLLRVMVDTERKPPEVVTAYRTSKVTKYWRRKQ